MNSNRVAGGVKSRETRRQNATLAPADGDILPTQHPTETCQVQMNTIKVLGTACLNWNLASVSDTLMSNKNTVMCLAFAASGFQAETIAAQIEQIRAKITEEIRTSSTSLEKIFRGHLATFRRRVKLLFLAGTLATVKNCVETIDRLRKVTDDAEEQTKLLALKDELYTSRACCDDVDKYATLASELLGEYLGCADDGEREKLEMKLYETITTYFGDGEEVFRSLDEMRINCKWDCPLLKKQVQAIPSMVRDKLRALENSLKKSQPPERIQRNSTNNGSVCTEEDKRRGREREPAANATATAPSPRKRASPPKRVSPAKRAREDGDDASVDHFEPKKKRSPRATSKPPPPPSEDDWKCPICLEVPRGQIHIKCSSGCTFCAECLEQAAALGDSCPMCREPYRTTRAAAHPIRNFPAERAIQDYRARFPGWGS